MAKKLSSCLGIDIGSRSIKVAEVKSQGREIVVSAVGITDTPEGAVDHTGVYNPEAVGAAIRKLIADSGASAPYAIVSVAGQASVLVKTLEVPRMNEKELADSMQWEINRNIPFSESTVVSDYKPLYDEDPASQNMDVVMAISPQSAIETLVSCIKKAGKQIAAIDVEPLGIARSLKASYDDVMSGKTVCVVEIGHKTTAINIYKDGKLLQPRQVPIGGEMFTRAIADAMSVSMDEAEQLKRTQADVSGLGAAASNPFASTAQFQPYNPFSDDLSSGAAMPGDATASDAGTLGDATAADAGTYSPAPVPAPVSGGNDQVNRAMTEPLDEFVAELRRSIDYFRGRGGDVNIVALCGGGAKLNGLSKFVETSLGVNCEVLDPMRNLNLNIRKMAPDFVDEHRQEFTVAVGNGLHIVF